MSLKQKLAARQLTIGSWLCLSSTQSCEIMATSGYDWLVVDMEHTATGTEQAAELIRVIDLAGCAPLVRVGDNDPLLIKRAMDAGAHGVIVPMVNAADDARRAVEALYYPPRGKRGVGLARAQGYGRSFENYREWADRESVLVVQIEHHEAVANLDEILAVEGVDAFMIGPYDLSGSFGKPGDFACAEMQAALARIAAVVKTSAKPAGVHIVHPDEQALRARIAEGYGFIAYGADMIFLTDILDRERQMIASLRVGN